MVPLRKYRPDLPYVIVTAEFPRARTVGMRESVEDSAYHLAPDWVASWLALYMEWGKVDWSQPSPSMRLTRGECRCWTGSALERRDLCALPKRAGSYG